MSHAGTNKSETNNNRAAQLGRSHGGNVLPRPPAVTGRTLPPPPPSAALKLRVEDVEVLPIVPQWAPEASDTPLRAPQRSSAGFWAKVLGSGISAGLLVGAGYLFAVAQGEQRAPRLYEIHAPAAQISDVRGLQPMAAAEPVRPSEILTSTVAPAAMPSWELPVAKEAPKAKQIAGKRARPARKTRPAKFVKEAPPAPEEVAEANDVEEAAPAPAAVAASKFAQKPTPKVEPLPEQPSRTDVQRGLEDVRPQLNACAQGTHGTTYANITIVGAGRVSYAMMGGDFAGTSAGSCMAKALRTATFPRFSGASFKVRYPFVF